MVLARPGRLPSSFRNSAHTLFNFTGHPRRSFQPHTFSNQGARRRASTYSPTALHARSLVTRLTNLFYGSSILLGLAIGYFYITDTRASVHRWLSVPLLRYLYPDAEDAHHAGTSILKTLYAFNVYPRERPLSTSSSTFATSPLAVTVFGYKLQSPLGISGGLDKNAEIPDPLLALGPSIVEVGGITPRPQPGNPQPRVFRLPGTNSLINRYGLNSQGADAVAFRLRQRQRLLQHGLADPSDPSLPPGSLEEGKLLAIQIAKNKDTPASQLDAVIADHVYCVERLGPYADILVVNVSSPNTADLRSLQRVEPLTKLLDGVVQAAGKIDRPTKPAVMVKVSPDEDSDDQIAGVCEAVWKTGVDGVIVGNTTNSRDPGAVTPEDRQVLSQTGGFSGPSLFNKTNRLVKTYRGMLDAWPEDDEKSRVKAALAERGHGSAERKVIFASGGITNGEQALQVMKSGASVAMVYTALVYGGVGTITRIKSELNEELKHLTP